MVLVIKEKNKKVVRVTSKPNKSSSKKNKLNKKISSQKILKKPQAKIVGVSAKKTLKGFADSAGPLVREVEKTQISREDNSLYFKRELEKERKWLA